MIVTLTVNPALDEVISVDRLAFEDRAYINSRRLSAGGRGINSSCVIHAFGGKTRALFISGGASGQRLEAYLSKIGLPFEAIPVAHAIRTNLTVTDKHGLTVNLNEAGPELSAEEVGRVERAVREAVAGASWLMLCGSLPPGAPTSFYGKTIALARQKGVATLLRATREALRDGIEAQPAVVALNHAEAEALLGRALLTRTHFLQAAGQIRSMGPETAILSLGSRGAVAAGPDGLFEALPPNVDAVCPIGAGDALTAAYVWAMRRKADRADALRWGVAAGTASACLPGMNFASLAQTEEMYHKVELRRAQQS